MFEKAEQHGAEVIADGKFIVDHEAAPRRRHVFARDWIVPDVSGHASSLYADVSEVP